ncbi:hypothetical protein L915_01837, partial [Phytophthora nicotianae]
NKPFSVLSKTQQKEVEDVLFAVSRHPSASFPSNIELATAAVSVLDLGRIDRQHDLCNVGKSQQPITIHAADRNTSKRWHSRRICSSIHSAFTNRSN